MDLIKRTQLRAFVVEGLNQVGEDSVGLETDQDLEKAAVRLTTLQLLDLAEMLEAVATNPDVFVFQELTDSPPPTPVLYCQVNGIAYRRCTETELPKFLNPEYFLELEDHTQGTSIWRKVFTGASGLTLATLQKLSKKETIAKATVLRRTAERLNSFNESFESLEALSSSVTKVLTELRSDTSSADFSTPTFEPSLFQTESISTIPTAVAMVSSIYAQLRKDLWKQDENGLGYFQHRAKGNPDNYVEHYISSPGDVEILPWEQAEQIIDKFGFTTVKLHLLFAAHTMNQSEPWKSSFVLKGTTILKELGWDKRTDIPIHEKLSEVAKAAFVLDCLLVKSVWVEGRGSRGRIDASTPTGRMWTVVIEPHGQLDVNGKISKPEEVFLGVQPGLIFERFLNKAGSKLREALYQFGYIAQEVLKIDPYHDELALRLAIHLTMDSRIHPSGKYQVGALLKTILPNAIIATARKDYRRAFDLKKRWDNALLLLMQLSWLVEFGDSYPEQIRPSSKARNPKGYLEILLAAEVTIKPKAPIPELLANNTKTRRSKPALKPTSTLTGEQIRQAREAKAWNQRQLAGWMGVSQSLINHWEKGKRTPNPTQEDQLKRVLNIAP